ncbi:Glycoprotein-N-acetylgalactosamine 3-beta-galactosyltransferase 1 [Cricetulus griseus]|uniref:Glycoprotein-N-acetylgalactosamine 3-beta-galactosyltransferase 1 n=1 Tax=Cricetulus griseus TaxID=10029 RepID=G3HJI2_CRIGR|nr:Glycoprotein-N-acetylgalactosamine 3-beta-galactosyltransferase 1 [Cricetulus griseus]
MASKSWLNFLTFLCGSAIGFFLCSQLFSILLGEQGDTQPNMLHNDPHARHLDDNEPSHLQGQVNFNADSSQHKDENTDIAENLYQKVKILCWVMTSSQNLEKKAKHVKATWAQYCNKVLFMSSEENQDFPTMGLKTKEGREQLYWKTIKTFQYVHDHYLEDADWLHFWWEWELVHLFWKSIWTFLRKLGIHLPQNPAITPGNIPKWSLSYHKDTYLTLLIEALFIIARNWKQPRCPSTEVDKENVINLHNGVLLSCYKSDIMTFAGKWLRLQKKSFRGR